MRNSRTDSGKPRKFQIGTLLAKWAGQMTLNGTKAGLMRKEQNHELEIFCLNLLMTSRTIKSVFKDF